MIRVSKYYEQGDRNMKEYRCSWAENYHADFIGTMDEILRTFTDLDPNVEEWFAWDFSVDATDGGYEYLTGGGVTMREFDQMSEINDKIECDNMTIKRIK
jgi:hypothetical protein